MEIHGVRGSCAVKAASRNVAIPERGTGAF